jgi:RimJ/RimL family protein N-acetyltransferase
MQLETPNLLICSFSSDDFDEIYTLLSEKQAMQYSLRGVEDRKGAKSYLDKILSSYEDNGYGRWAIYLKKDQTFIGYCGLSKHEINGISYVELGYRLKGAFWGKGYATEAAKAVRDYAFSVLKKKELISIIEKTNVRSMNVARKLGFHKKCALHYKGYDCFIFSKEVIHLVEKDWSPLFEQIKKTLVEVFDPQLIEFFHIGSTAISGIGAKPVIDMMGACNDLLQIENFLPRLEAIGFNAYGSLGIPNRLFFKKLQEPKAHLHIFEKSDLNVQRHLRFVKYMNTHPKEKAAYNRLKKSLQKKYLFDVRNYTTAKSAFIKNIDLKAAQIPAHPFATYPKREAFTKKELQQAMQRNVLGFAMMFCNYIPVCRCLNEIDCVCMQSDIKDRNFNFIVDAQLKTERIKERIHTLLNVYRAKDIPFVWWLFDTDQPKNLMKFLLDEGLQHQLDMPGMALNLDEYNLQKTQLHFEWVKTLDQHKLFDFLHCKANNTSENRFRHMTRFIPPTIFYNETVKMCIGYFDRNPVVTGILFLDANVAGIYQILTLPEFRKRGFATQMMHFLLKTAKEAGYHFATLQTSKQGLSIYKKGGFRTIATYQQFIA